MVTAIANVYIYINNLPRVYVPNSLSFKDGRGESIVRTQALGGGASEIVVSDNVETHYGMVKFQMRSDVDNIENALIWRDNKTRGGNVIVLVDRFSDFNLTFKTANIINDVEYEIAAEGNFELEFHSEIPV